MTHASLFSGIGGFDLAAEWMGWKNVFQVEINNWCQKVLRKNFPHAALYSDIKNFKGTDYHGSIDVISGGFPCQPFSISNQQKRDDDSRKLWPEMLRVIREIEPTWVVGENVPNIKKLALDSIISDLEACGYTTEVFIIPALAVGAIHRRDRIWITAHTNSQRFKEYRHERQQTGQNAAQPFQWPSESPVCGADDGLSGWVDEVGGLGNAISPQVAYEIFKAIEETDKHC